MGLGSSQLQGSIVLDARRLHTPLSHLRLTCHRSFLSQVTPSHESLLGLGPIPNAVFVLVLGVHPRIHERIVRQMRPTTPVKPRSPLRPKPR